VPDETKTPEEGMVDEATAIKRQITAACAAIEHANSEGLGLAVMIFLSEDGQIMTVFGIDGIDVGEVLEAAASQTWDMTDDQPLRGC
jgi:hypothetical protein